MPRFQSAQALGKWIRELFDRRKRRDAYVSQLLARIHELEARIRELDVAKKTTKKPLRDRADYMREYMRRKRAGRSDGE
jgi:hypothetical protein